MLSVSICIPSAGDCGINRILHTLLCDVTWEQCADQRGKELEQGNIDRRVVIETQKEQKPRHVTLPHLSPAVYFHNFASEKLEITAQYASFHHRNAFINTLQRYLAGLQYENASTNGRQSPRLFMWDLLAAFKVLTCMYVRMYVRMYVCLYVYSIVCRFSAKASLSNPLQSPPNPVLSCSVQFSTELNLIELNWVGLDRLRIRINCLFIEFSATLGARVVSSTFLLPSGDLENPWIFPAGLLRFDRQPTRNTLMPTFAHV